MSETIDDYIRLGEACHVSGEVYEERGETLRARGEYRKAVEYYDKALELVLIDFDQEADQEAIIEGYAKVRNSYHGTDPQPYGHGHGQDSYGAYLLLGRR